MDKGVTILDSRVAWRRLALSLAVATVGNVGMWSIIVILPQVQADFGIDRAAASLLYTMTMIGFALGNLVIGRAVDRFGIAWALIVAGLVIGLGHFLATISGSVAVLAAVQFVIGMGASASFGPMMADVSQWFDKRRGIAVAIAASGNYLAGAIWPLLLAGTIRDHGWRASYLVLAVGVPVLVTPLALMLQARVPDEARIRSDTRVRANVARAAMSPRRLQFLLAVAGLGCCVAMAMPQVHLVAYCADLGYGPAVGAQMLSLMLMGGVVSRLVSGLVADRLGGVLTLLIGSSLQCLALFLYLPFDGLVSLFMVSLVFGLSQGGIVPSYTLIVREYLPAREAGARVGFVIMATILGMALGGWLSGWIYDVTGSYQMAFLNGIAWNLMNIAIIGTLFLRGRPGRMQAVAA